MMKIKYLLPEEKMELFDVIKQDTSSYAIRNCAIFYIAEYCALRASEIGKIKLESVQLRNGILQIYCERLKGSRNNTLKIIDQEVSAALSAYMHIRSSLFPSSQYLFLSQRNTPISRKTLDGIMRNYCSKTHIPPDKHHFHVLKHTRAVELGDEGLQIQDIQWWMGHVNINNTIIYSQFTTTQQEHLYQKLMGKERIKEDARESKNQRYF